MNSCLSPQYNSMQIWSSDLLHGICQLIQYSCQKKGKMKGKVSLSVTQNTLLQTQQQFGWDTYKAIAVVRILITVYDKAPCLHLLINVLGKRKIWLVISGELHLKRVQKNKPKEIEALTGSVLPVNCSKVWWFIRWCISSLSYHLKKTSSIQSLQQSLQHAEINFI